MRRSEKHNLKIFRVFSLIERYPEVAPLNHPWNRSQWNNTIEEAYVPATMVHVSPGVTISEPLECERETKLCLA